MKHLAAASAFGLAILTASLAGAQTYQQPYPPPPGAGPAIQDVTGYPPDQVYGPQPDPNAPPDPNDDPASYPNYQPTADTDVTVDERVAQSYDDGYDPQAYGQFE